MKVEDSKRNKEQGLDAQERVQKIKLWPRLKQGREQKQKQKRAIKHTQTS